MRRSRRIITVAVAAVFGAALLLVLAVLASAALDQPSKTIQSEVTIEASPQTVWSVLTNFEEYASWNPLMTRAEGNAQLGAQIEVDVEPLGGDEQDLSPEITTLRPERKLAWKSREVLPGLSDREYEAIIDVLGDERVRVTMHERFEGLLIPFTSTEEEQAGFDLMAAALKRRAEAATSGTGG